VSQGVVSGDGEPVKQGVCLFLLQTADRSSRGFNISTEAGDRQQGVKGCLCRRCSIKQGFWFMTEGETADNEIGFRFWVIDGSRRVVAMVYVGSWRKD
jgi:hypothetical protein